MPTESESDPPGPPIRVLYSFPHPLGAPGIGTTALNQVRGLVERGLEVTVCCTNVAVDRAGLPDDIVETLTVAGTRIPHRVLGVDRAMRYHDRRAAQLLRRRQGSFDVAHGWPLGSAATLEAAESLGLVGLRESPNTYTAVAYERVAREVARLGLTVPRGASHQFNSGRLALEEQEYEQATGILAPSDAVKDSYSLRAGPPLNVLRHRYGFAPEQFPPPAARRPDASPFVLAFVGSCEPRKGLHYALRAWRSAGLAGNGARFLIVGRWEADYRQLLSSELEAPGIELMDFCDDVGGILRSADALILPSIEEGSALVTYEAQASGCALLVSDAAGALMTDGVHGHVHPVGDVDMLTDQLTRLATDSDHLARLRSAVIAHRDELTWAAAATRLEKVYGSVLGGI